MGENGAGKTTLAKILMGLYEPTSGRILVDGIDLNEVAPADWHRRIGAVFRDFTRYQASVRENIGFGRPVAKTGDCTGLSETCRDTRAG